MTVVGSASSVSLNLASLLSNYTAPANRSGFSFGATTGETTSVLDAATTIDLSEEAIATLKRAKDASDAIENLPKTLDELVAQKTDEVAAKLTDLLARRDIPIGEGGIKLRFDASGKIVTDGRYKEEIEELLEENPELVEDLKAVDTLHTLRATLEALRVYREEEQNADNDAERDAARSRFVTHSINIQAVSGHLTLTEDGLSTAASDYASAFFGSGAPGEEDDQTSEPATIRAVA